jgi:hypothetical protein
MDNFTPVLRFCNRPFDAVDPLEPDVSTSALQSMVPATSADFWQAVENWSKSCRSAGEVRP